MALILLFIAINEKPNKSASPLDLVNKNASIRFLPFHFESMTIGYDINAWKYVLIL